jgi:hypothetical protein
LGRPPHIEDEFCDIEMPQASDFDDPRTEGPLYGVVSQEHITYFVHMTKLSVQSLFSSFASPDLTLKAQ